MILSRWVRLHVLVVGEIRRVRAGVGGIMLNMSIIVVPMVVRVMQGVRSPRVSLRVCRVSRP